MKKNNILIIVACAGLIVSCAATAPRELLSAREAYRRASTGPAAEVAPAELHVASQALAAAEQSFMESPDSYQTRDLSYIAQRKSQMAEATASITTAQKKQDNANGDYEATQSKIVASTKHDLNQTRKELSASEREGAMTEEQLADEKKARAAAEKQAADALAALAKFAVVKEVPRGTVITLSGSVLFASAQATLLPEAQTRLDQVAAVLLSTRERNIVIEGHTDSQGSDSYNMDLSQRRADAVRNYLVQRQYEGDLITARGFGEGQPIADNGNAEGRANNRRVEIVIERDAHASNR